MLEAWDEPLSETESSELEGLGLGLGLGERRRWWWEDLEDDLELLDLGDERELLPEPPFDDRLEGFFLDETSDGGGEVESSEPPDGGESSLVGLALAFPFGRLAGALFNQA